MTAPIEIFVEAPTRRVIGYACGVCRLSHLRQHGPEESLRAARACCFCDRHSVVHKRPAECPECVRERGERADEAWRKREAARLAEAVPWDDDMEGLFYDDRLYPTPVEFFDDHADRVHPDKIDPTWIPLLEEAEPEGPLLDAEQIIGDANERAEVEGDGLNECLFLFPRDKAALEELQTVLDAWAEKHAPSRQWFKPGRPVRLDRELAEWLRENPDMVEVPDEEGA